jgi:hypothetical protein
MTSPTFLAALAIVGTISTTTSAQTPFPMPDPVLVPPMLAAVQQPPPPPPPPPPAPAARSPQAPKPPATPGPAQPPKPPAPPPPPDSPTRQSVNIQVDVTIQSQGGTGTPISKTMTMLVADRRQTTLTAQASRGFRRLNGDVRANLLRDGKLDMSLNLDFDVSEVKEVVPPTQDQGGTAYRGVVNVVLDNGKPLIISKSADPLTDRTVTVEVKATILK